ncbi:MAG: hypothetical protein V9F04_07325 [Dermatophilaceae bacterium]
MTTSLTRRAVLALMPMTLLAACTGRTDVALVSDDTLDKALVAQTTATAPRLLRDLTGFAWDEVMLVSEGTTAGEIQGLTGQRIIKGDRYLSSANLMVFRTGGEVTKAVMISPDAFSSHDLRRWFGRDVTVGTGSILRLT